MPLDRLIGPTVLLRAPPRTLVRGQSVHRRSRWSWCTLRPAEQATPRCRCQITPLDAPDGQPRLGVVHPFGLGDGEQLVKLDDNDRPRLTVDSEHVSALLVLLSHLVLGHLPVPGPTTQRLSTLREIDEPPMLPGCPVPSDLIPCQWI
jgi:hypothetical protein